MKTKTIVFLVIAAIVMSAVAVGTAMANDCAKIKDGTIVDSAGIPLQLGYDQWGYNYQAHMFNGWYHNAPRPDPPYTKDTIDQAPSKTRLVMWWNDAWLSNKDCTDDGLLDRHYGHASYRGSGAWLTNHQFGTYVEDGETCNWDYFVKIVAVPEDAVAEDGIWYRTDETEIGPVIWGSFAIIQEVENDPCAGVEGIQYLSPASPGFGCYNP